jgi:hypothetical protein
MPTLQSALTPQQSFNYITNKLSNRRDGQELAKLFQALYTDLSVLQANHNILLAHLDTIATSAGYGSITGTLMTTANRGTYGSDAPITTSGGTITSIPFIGTNLFTF